MIVGIDEVGRGPWAGPLVVGAVVLGQSVIEGLTDSKKLSKARRESLSREIIESADGYGLGWVDASELDEIGLSESLVLATKRALEQITAPYHEIIIDGTVNFLKDTRKGQYVTTMKKADLLIGAVSAASIIAKVARDDYMEDLATYYPEYGFDSHVGYGTAKHRAAIARFGIIDEHRKSFAPIARIIGDGDNNMVAAPAVTSKQIGNDAESAAVEWLFSQGYDVVERNWKTKFCEIDIIALRDNTLYFVEVKHRTSQAQGGGISVITARKLRQMRFAATLFLTKYPDTNARLAVLTTTSEAGRPAVSPDGLLLIE